MSKGRYPIGAVVSRETGEVRLIYRENGTDEEFMGILSNLLKVGRMIEQFEATSIHASRAGDNEAREQRQLLSGQDVSTRTPSAREVTRLES